MVDNAEQRRLSLREGEVHLWIVEPNEIQSGEALELYYPLLDDEERERHAGFVFHSDRHRFLVAHALVRVVLSRYACTSPAACRFSVNAYGRPELVDPGNPPLRWSLSHARGMAICAVALGADVGVDVEDVQQDRRIGGVADAHFAPDETAALRRLPEERQRPRFFEYWTLKEAYVKARGVGLTIPLNEFSFQVERGRPPQVSFAPQFDDRAEEWRFVQLWLSRRHVSAVALRRSRELGLVLRCQRTVPLASDAAPYFVRV